MKTLWIKIRNWFTPYRDKEEVKDMKAIADLAFKQEVDKQVDKRISIVFKQVELHLNRRVESLLKARAASKDTAAKQSYNGTIKELRTVKDLIFGQ